LENIRTVLIKRKTKLNNICSNSCGRGHMADNLSDRPLHQFSEHAVDKRVVVGEFNQSWRSEVIQFDTKPAYPGPGKDLIAISGHLLVFQALAAKTVGDHITGFAPEPGL